MKKTVVLYACIYTEGSYGAQLVGVGQTLNAAFEKVQEHAENISGTVPGADDCLFYTITHLAVDTKTKVVFKVRK